MLRSTFFFLGRDFKNRDFSIETWLRQDFCQDFSRFIEISRHYRDLWGTSGSKISTNWEISIEKCDKLTNSWSRSRQTVEICQKCHVSTDFSISTFGTGRWCRDKIEISRSSRLTFWKCRDFLNSRDQLSASVEIESLDRDTIETNWDPQAC
jgi:hypothetical protein